MMSKNTKTREEPVIHLLASPDWKDYELVDSGEGAKLERYGPYIFSRPEPEAVWRKSSPEKVWAKADAWFQPTGEEHGGHWVTRSPLDARWKMAYKGLRFWAATSSSRHLGIFPEQAVHWDWIAEQVAASRRPLKVLNLFAYTGLGTLAAAQAGARVTHVDASRKAITWARDNLELSGLNDRPVRWIVDDALKFVQREGRRNAQYDGLILDPPKFGRGPKGEVWEFYKLLPALLAECRKALAPQPVFVVLTAYAVKASALTVYYALDEMLAGLSGSIQAGELALREHSGGHMLSNAIYARWSAGDL